MAQGFVVVANQGYVLGARPAFELGFASHSSFERHGAFAIYQTRRRVILRKFGSETVAMFAKTLCHIPRMANVK